MPEAEAWHAMLQLQLTMLLILILPFFSSSSTSLPASSPPSSKQKEECGVSSLGYRPSGGGRLWHSFQRTALDEALSALKLTAQLRYIMTLTGNNVYSMEQDDRPITNWSSMRAAVPPVQQSSAP